MINPESHLFDKVSLYCGDCLDVLRQLPDNMLDSVVTDPPYALVSIVKRFGADAAAPAKSEGASGVYARASSGFMGQKWDTGERAFSVEFWQEVFRVLKPGGYVVAFSATRTYHRLACAVEDSGFEVRDMLAWLYGTGFPKSHDISKAIDRHLGVDREVIGTEMVVNDMRNSSLLADERGDRPAYSRPVTVATSEQARQWEGWGTALKPALEPVVLARKPIIGSNAENVLAYGVGGLNIDACRIPIDAGDGWDVPAPDTTRINPARSGEANGTATDGRREDGARAIPHPEGRWPANLMHDGSPDVVAGFPVTGPSSGRPRNNGEHKSHAKGRDLPHVAMGHDDNGGSAARFFFSAKAQADDRLTMGHPTVKPVDLMRWLVRLVTPRGGLVLDPFAGTGTTGEAAFYEGFRSILVEREPQYQEFIRHRMALAAHPAKRKAVAKLKRTGGKYETLAGAEGTPLFAGLNGGGDAEA